MNKKILLLILVAATACSTTEATPTLQEIEVSRVVVTPALSPLKPILFACAALQPEEHIFIQERFPAAAEDPDILIQLGEPEDFPPFSYPLGSEGLILALHPDNPVTSLDQNQIRDIFGGQVRRWKPLGGDNAPIQVWTFPRGNQTRSLFNTAFLQDRKITPNARVAASPQVMHDDIAEDPAAVGYLPHAWATTDVKPIALEGQFPILALAEVQPEGPAYTFLNCLQGETGQGLISPLYALWDQH